MKKENTKEIMFVLYAKKQNLLYNVNIVMDVIRTFI